MNDTDIDRIARWLAVSKRTVIFSGAGMSTESGIPDFRSPGGIWTKYRTVYYDDFMSSAAARLEYWQQKCEGHRDFATARPNVGHDVVAGWESAGKVRGVITQNIDGLHQMAGSRNVLELHGTARAIQCQDCRATFAAEPLVAQFLATHQVPACPACGEGRLKHATVSFGQSLPRDVLEEATCWCQESELLFAIGSSLVVTPAADLPRIAKECGARLVIINRDPTPLDFVADAVIHDGIGATLQAVSRSLGEGR